VQKQAKLASFNAHAQKGGALAAAARISRNMKSPIQKHRSCDCQNPHVFIGKIDMVKIPMFLYGQMFAKHGQHIRNTWSKIIKHMVNNHQHTWSNIVKTHGRTSSANMVNNHQTTLSDIVKQHVQTS
jgi:hypothetical protein